MKAEKSCMRAFLPLCLAVLVFLAACADLKSIRKFADISADSAGYTALSVDYVKSIEREKRYQEEKFHKDLDEKIKKRKEQQPALLGLHKGVEEYMKAIGALAADELVSYDKSIDSIAEDVKKTKLVEDKVTDAFSAIIKIITKAATDAYRQRELNRIISESNKDLQIVLTAMINIVELDFVSSLENEKVAIEKFYKEIVIVSEKAPPQQASIQLLRETWQKKQDEIETKEQSCIVYSRTLKKIAEGHQLLFDNRDKLSSRQVLDLINNYSNDISNLLKSVTNLN
jgi:protoporphyrinogen oxidase